MVVVWLECSPPIWKITGERCFLDYKFLAVAAAEEEGARWKL